MSIETGKQNKPLSLRARNTGSSFAQSAVALAIGVAGSGVGSVSAQENQDDSSVSDTNAIELIEVYGQRTAPYKALRSGDERRGAALADTPQTLTILTQTQIEDSGKTDLKEILAAQSGITLGTGENGNAFGDRYIIRGHEARSDVFVDGVRDPGMTTRESFATEQIEITKGPSSTFAGRGSSGGAVNGISKQANAQQDFSMVKGGVGSDGYHRVTLDSNHVINDRVAVRANLLHAEEEVPDRDPASKERIGGLLSAKFQVTDQFSLLADYYHLEANDVPDLGSYFDQATRKPVSDIAAYSQDSDFLETQVDAFTFKADYQFTDNLRLQNATRFGKTDNGYIVTGLRGTARSEGDPVAPGVATASLSTHQGWQEVDYTVNQTNLFWDLAQGDVEHKLVFGFEYSDEQVANGVFNTENTGATNCVVSGRGGDSEGYCAIDANGNYVTNLNSLLGRTFERGSQDSDFNVETISAYVMDSVMLNDRWSGFFGVRYDDFDYSNRVVSRGNETEYDYSDGMWNGHAGIVRALGDNGNVYLTYSTATNINGGESDVGGSCGYGGLCGDPDQVGLSDPEQVTNFELGTKWELFDDRLLATAALFSITKDDVMESVGDSYSTLGTLNTGKNRVQGIELSLTGAITEKLSAQFNAAFMDSEVLEAFNPEQVGLALSNFADNHAYLQLRYDATTQFSFGGAITYKSEMYGGQPDTAAGFNQEIGDYSIVVPSYQVVDLFVNYYPSEKVNLKLSLNNVTDEEYWTAAYRSGAFMYLGEAQSVRATLTYNF
ncbi:TonB-dependent receptor [Arenicella xantha]|uniref:Catecholate siderophore receptor n=1 Tax=Arenicella xantha TaxID=644221 RepID=A0A395JIW3_9GAMM|nr:TonB-dependent receptor [Arenicella xantha]RBP48877.1 catecholate siderophore receptor [Arenicella xantha]